MSSSSDEPASQTDGRGPSVTQRSTRDIPADLRLQVANGRGCHDGAPDGGDSESGPGGGGTIASRPTYTELQLEAAYQNRMEPEERKAHRQTILEERRAGKEVKDKRAIALGIITRIFPCIKVLLNYDIREYGPYDLLSGISVGLFLIPQSIAYALLANLQPQYGFYTAFFAMIIYFIFGTSKHLNMTTHGAVSLLVGEAVRSGFEQVYPGRVGICADPRANATLAGYNGTATAASFGDASTIIPTAAAMFSTSPITAGLNYSHNGSSVHCMNKDDAFARIALTITVIAGSLQLLLGLMQFGFLTIYLSDPINSAFACGAALHIVVSQLGNMLGAPIPTLGGNGKFFIYIIEAFKKIIATQVNVPTIVATVVALAILFAVKILNERCVHRIKMPIPIDIIVLIISLLLSKFLRWQQTLNISPVGEIKKGFEAPRAPQLEHFTSGSGIIVNGIVLGIISYAMSVSLAKTFALRNGYEIDANQEMIAYGAVNLGMSWFSTFVSAAAITCTSLNESMKGKTQVYSLYAIVITLIGILVFAPEFSPVPKCVLSAIIVANLKNMILQVEQLPRLWRTNRFDFAIFLVTLLAILGLDLPLGLLIGVVFSLATVIFRTQAPKAYLLGRLPNTDIYRNIKNHKKAEQIPGMKIFKFDGSLYFASAENYRNRLYRQVAINPKTILAKAEARAKREARPTGDMNLRTGMPKPEGVKEMLKAVTEEGCHLVAEARIEAQVNPPDEEIHSPLESMAYHSEKEETGFTVNIFCIILDLSACAFTDSVGIRMLTQIVDEFNKIGVEIYLSGCNWLLRSQMRKAGFYAKRSEEGLFVTIHDAVIHALSAFYQELLEEDPMKHHNGGPSTCGEVTDQPSEAAAASATVQNGHGADLGGLIKESTRL